MAHSSTVFFYMNSLFCDIDFISRAAASTIRKGGLVIFPTSGVYGLAGNARDIDVVSRIFSIKNRSLKKPISVIVSSIDEVKLVAKFVSDYSRLLMDKFWPGGVTFVLEASDNLPSLLTAGTGKIGVRVPLNRIAMALVENCAFPITATSANVSGEPSATRVEDIDFSILTGVDLVIDNGQLGNGVGSTVVDAIVKPLKILREGIVGSNEFG